MSLHFLLARIVLSLVCMFCGCFVGGQCKCAYMVCGVECFCILRGGVCICMYFCVEAFYLCCVGTGFCLCCLEMGLRAVVTLYIVRGQFFGVFCFVGLVLQCLTWSLLSLCLFWLWIYGVQTLLYQYNIFIYPIFSLFCFVSSFLKKFIGSFCWCF